MSDESTKLAAMEADIKKRLAAIISREEKHEQVVADFKARQARADASEREVMEREKALGPAEKVVEAKAEHLKRMEDGLENRVKELEGQMREVSNSKSDYERVKRGLETKEKGYQDAIAKLGAENEKLDVELRAAYAKRGDLSELLRELIAG